MECALIAAEQHQMVNVYVVAVTPLWNVRLVGQLLVIGAVNRRYK
jgi:hypothetical protein